MTIKYHWNDMKATIIEGGYPKEIITDVEYEYSHAITKADIVDYLMPTSETQKGLANFYMTKMLEFLIENRALDISELDNDDYFVEYIHDKYEQDAKEEWEEENL